MVERDFLLSKLPPYEGNKKMVIQSQTADDIINEMLSAHKQHKNDYDKIAGYFWKGNLKSTAQYIFDFLKKNVNYSIEPDERQSIKSPASILATGYFKNGYNDCKHYSQFISGILDSLRRSGKKIDWFYRFANYRIYADDPQHVFVVATDGKNEFWIDPVLKYFNDRKPYVNKIDKKISPMALYKINGLPIINGSVGLQPICGSIGRRKKSAPGGTKKKKGGIFKKLGKGIKNFHKGLAKGVKKVAMAPSRASFMAILKINPFKMANNLNAALDNPGKRNKLLKKWKLIGGNPAKLEKAIRSQYAHWKKRKGIKGIGYIHIDGIGFVHHIVARKMKQKQKQRRRINLQRRRQNMPPLPISVIDTAKFTLPPATVQGIGAVQLVALLAAAAPIIAILAEFLPKGMKDKSAKAAEEISDSTQAAALQAIEKQDPTVRQEREAGEGSANAAQTQQLINESQEPTDKGSGFKIDNKTLMIGGGIAAAFFLLNKNSNNGN